MNRYQVAAALAAATYVAGCATPQSQRTEPVAEPVYMTGSRLPVRDNGANAAAAAIADQNPQRGIKDDLMKGTINPIKTSN